MAAPTTAPEFVSGFDLKDATTTTRMAKPKPDDTSVILRNVRVPLTSDVGSAFVADCARNRERIFSDDRIREKYEINSDAAWDGITKNKALRLAINTECERRMLNGTAAQESAAKIFMESPEAMGSILRDQKASPRHRIEASKELRATARSGDEKPGADAERVVITINLGNAPEDKLVFDCGPLKQPKGAVDAETDQW